MDLAQVIRKSLREAQHQPLDGPTKRILHSQRSQAWVKALGANLMSSGGPDRDLRCFTRFDLSNKPDFGVNELLYDISIVRVSDVASAVLKKRLVFITDAVWQVESEFGLFGVSCGSATELTSRV